MRDESPTAAVAQLPLPRAAKAHSGRFRWWALLGLAALIGLQTFSPPVSACVPSPDPIIDDPCANEPDVIRNKVSYTEVRGRSGVAAHVLEDGTLVAIDFASGEIAFTLTNGQVLRVQRSELDIAAQANLLALAQLIAAAPGFSFESGYGPAPIRPGSPPRVPGRGYPLSLRTFGLQMMKDGGDGESPCREPGACNPPIVFDRIIVTAPPNSAPSGRGDFRFWWHQATTPSTPGTPTISDQIDRALREQDAANWARWRDGRCADRGIAMLAASAAAVPAGKACAGSGFFPPVCAAALLAYLVPQYEAVRAGLDCNSVYHGMGTWP